MPPIIKLNSPQTLDGLPGGGEGKAHTYWHGPSPSFLAKHLEIKSALYSWLPFFIFFLLCLLWYHCFLILSLLLWTLLSGFFLCSLKSCVIFFFFNCLFTVYSLKAVVFMLGASTMLRYVPRAFWDGHQQDWAQRPAEITHYQCTLLASLLSIIFPICTFVWA